MSVIGSWLQRITRENDATIRLVCFPHAGGAASAFRLWPAGLPPGTELLAVQYPGRANRLGEPLVDRISMLAHHVCQELVDRPTIPTVFFGHSMGSLVAFESAHRMQKTTSESPRHLVLAAHAPPHLPSSNPPIAHLPDEDFLRELDRRYAAIPSELMRYPDVLALLLPALRADITAVEHCGESNLDQITSPVTVFGGVDDRTTPRPRLDAWQELTRGSFQFRLFPGGHFFIEPERKSVLEALSAILEGVAKSDNTAAMSAMRGQSKS